MFIFPPYAINEVVGQAVINKRIAEERRREAENMARWQAQQYNDSKGDVIDIAPEDVRIVDGD